MAEAEQLEVVPGLWIPVASVAGLVSMKLLSADPLRRPTDLADLQGLAAVMTGCDVAEVRRLLQLMAVRGSGRGRDFQRAFQDWVAPWLLSTD